MPRWLLIGADIAFGSDHYHAHDNLLVAFNELGTQLQLF